jgi:hypothetical protein
MQLTLAMSLRLFASLLLQLFVAAVPGAIARTISWSGYSWDVRPPGTGEPGPNTWSDSSDNVRVEGSDLVLSIVQDRFGRWTSAEIDNRRHLGYGTYRWVVATDLSALDANEVLGLFTYTDSGPSHNEIDIESSHWGHLSSPTGSVTVWQNADLGLSEQRNFDYSNRPPYVNQFTWAPGSIRFVVTDATGRTLFDSTIDTGVPVPSTEVPVINYWRFDNVAPVGVRTIRISSFTWAPLGQTLPPATNPGGSRNVLGAPPSAPTRGRWECAIGDSAAAVGGKPAAPPVSVSMTMRPNRFTTVASRRHSVLQWSATGAANLELIIDRRIRGRRFVRIGTVRRTVHDGRGRISIWRKLGTYPIMPGTYGVRLKAGATSVRCAPRRFLITIERTGAIAR